MGIIIDLIFLGIIIFTIIFSSKHGFVRTLLELVGFVAAFIIAFTVSTPIAEYTYDNFIGPTIVKSMDEIIVENSAELPQNIYSIIPEKTRKTVEFLGITEEEISKAVIPEIKSGTADITNIISNKVLRPAITSVICATLNLLLIILLVPLFKWLAKIVNKLFSFSIIGKLNRTLGGILGAIKGVAFCLIICVILNFVISITQSGFWIFTPEVLDESILFSAAKPLIS